MQWFLSNTFSIHVKKIIKSRFLTIWILDFGLLEGIKVAKYFFFHIAKASIWIEICKARFFENPDFSQEVWIFPGKSGILQIFPSFTLNMFGKVQLTSWIIKNGKFLKQNVWSDLRRDLADIKVQVIKLKWWNLGTMQLVLIVENIITADPRRGFKKYTLTWDTL